MLNLCESSTKPDRIFCHNCAALFFGAVNQFAESAFNGKRLPVWLIEDAPKDPEQLSALRTKLRVLATAMGDATRSTRVVLSLEESGSVQTKLEEISRPTGGSLPVVRAATANRLSRDNAAVLYGPRIDVSGLSQLTEIDIRSRLGQDALTTVPASASAPR